MSRNKCSFKSHWGWWLLKASLVIFILTGTGRFPSAGCFNLDDVWNQGDGQMTKDEQIAFMVRAIIKHFKQDDPKGLPEELGKMIPDPMPAPDMDQDFSVARMKFHDSLVYGLTTFRLDFIKVHLDALKITIGLSLEKLEMKGKYRMSSWFSVSKGNFTTEIEGVETHALLDFTVDPSGKLAIENLSTDATFQAIKMDFENPGLLSGMLQGAINKAGPSLFENIKPMVLEQAESMIKSKIEEQARSTPTEFPNSISPVDMFIIKARIHVREQQFDPFILPELEVPGASFVRLTGGVLHGLSTFYRTGPLLVEFNNNTISLTVNIGTREVSGKYIWRLGFINGEIGFSVNHIKASVTVSQPANIDKDPSVNKIDLDVGNIAVRSDGAGTLDYVVEATVNILPNLFRYVIINAIEEPLRQRVEEEIRKNINVEQIIEEQLSSFTSKSAM